MGGYSRRALTSLYPIATISLMEFLHTGRHNDCPTPEDFEVGGAWEIRERLISSDLGDTRPVYPPKVDTSTKFIVGEGVPRYVVEENADLGTGGYATVHRGWDRRLGKYVAVKRLDRYWLDESEIVPLFELEAKSLSRTSHPGIPEVYDFTVIHDREGHAIPIIIMELVRGECLSDRLLDYNKSLLPIDEVTRIINQTASTLDYIDRIGLHHGDIKSKNVLLAKPYLKLVDFGNSDWANPQGPKGYTPGYAAPELFGGKMDIKSDEYSLAATAYEILFHTTPPENFQKNIKKIYLSHIKYKIDADTRERLLEIFQKGMATNPDERYESCTAFANAFCEVLIKQEDILD